jgi:hypothetical protein
MNRRGLVLGSAAAAVMAVIQNVKGKGAAVSVPEDEPQETFSIWPSPSQERLLFPGEVVGQYGTYVRNTDGRDGSTAMLSFVNHDTNQVVWARRNYFPPKVLETNSLGPVYWYEFILLQGSDWRNLVKLPMQYGGVQVTSIERLNSEVLHTFDLFIAESIKGLYY